VILGIGAGATEGPDPGQMPRQVFTRFSINAAPWVGSLLLLVWGVTEIKKLGRRRLFDRQSGLDSMGELSWQEFEQLVCEAYRRQGYAVEHTGSHGGDGGVDLTLRRGGETVLVQCKHWKAWRVGVKEVRELLGVVTSERANQGIVVTYGSFTEEAIAFGRKNPITLVAGPELERLIHSVQRTKAQSDRRSVGDRLDADGATYASVADLPDRLSKGNAVPMCPLCGSRMVERTAKRGQFSGQAFLGCSRYPGCRGTRKI
jgi:restriction system protein